MTMVVFVGNDSDVLTTDANVVIDASASSQK